MNLPTVKITTRLPDPEWKAVFEPGNTIAVNDDSYSKDYEVEVEVLTINLNSGTMRVRFPWFSKASNKMAMNTIDVSNDVFFTKYDIVEKTNEL